MSDVETKNYFGQFISVHGSLNRIVTMVVRGGGSIWRTWLTYAGRRTQSVNLRRTHQASADIGSQKLSRLAQKDIVRIPKATKNFREVVSDSSRKALQQGDKSIASALLRKANLLQDLDLKDVDLLIRMSLADHKLFKMLLDSTERMRESHILQVFRVLTESQHYDHILSLVPRVLGVKRKRSPEFVVSIVQIACLAGLQSSVDDPSQVLADTLTFDAGHLHLDQRAYDSHISIDRLGWSHLPADGSAFVSKCVADGLQPDFAAKVYRHANVALCISMNRGASSDKLVEAIKRSLESNHYIAIVTLLQVFEEAHQSWLTVTYEQDAEAAWTTRTWATLLRGLISKHHLQLAQAAWETFNRCKPSTQQIPTPIWNALLTGYADIGDWTRAGQIWDMIDEKSRADTHLITTMITTLFKARRPHEAILHYDQVKQIKKKLDVAIVNAYLMGLTLNDQVNLAIQTLMAMAQQTDPSLPLPNSRSFNIALRAIGRHGTLENLVSILGYMNQSDVLPDTVTFTTVLDALARFGVSDTLPDVYTFMQSSGVRVNEVTMTAMIKSSLDEMNDNPEKGLLSALDLLQQMESNGPAPTAVTYTAIMTAVRKDNQCVLNLFRSGRLPQSLSEQLVAQYSFDRQRRWSKQASSIVCLMLFERMKRLRIEPNSKTLNLLIHILVGEDARALADDVLLGESFAIVLSLFDRLTEPSRPTDKTVLMLLQHVRALAQQDRPACKPYLAACLDRLLRFCHQDHRMHSAITAIVDTAARVEAMADV